MRSLSSILLVLGSVAVAVNAHFTISFPPARGEFNEDDSVNYCGGHNDVNTTRTEFPISGGYVNLAIHHETWTVGYLLSNDDSPESFEDFSQIGTFAQSTGIGDYCLTLDLQSTNATGLEDGANRTLQIVFDGGDGQLYQCADITLSTSVDISSVPCANSTETHVHEEDEDHDHDHEDGEEESEDSQNSSTKTRTSTTGVIGLLLACSIVSFML